MNEQYYAHTLEGHPAEEWHKLEEHLLDTADAARRFAEVFDADELAYLTGLWHDLGKYSQAFQKYLLASAAGGRGLLPRPTTRVDHSTAGAQHAEKAGPLGRILAYIIAGHHAGLPDNVCEGSGLSDRLQKKIEPIDDAPKVLIERPAPRKPRLNFESMTSGSMGFTLAFYTRMLFSCLVDADFLDTERFMDPARAAYRPQQAVPLTSLQARLDVHLKDERFARPSTVNDHRRLVLEACRSKAELPPGFFSLNVPTGGGKTLSSLAFASRHALTHRLNRIFYAIPFTSIIEQTADVFRTALDDLEDAVLEHHSNLEEVDPDGTVDPSNASEAPQTQRRRLAAENFDAALIVTTNVQLFESLFASRTSRCRKLHRFARSVIILDEAQSLPPNLLEPTLAALKELVRNYGASVVLCTATQPAIEKRDPFPIGLTDVRPIIGNPIKLHEALRRTKVEYLGRVSNDEIVNRLRAERQALCIVNSRKHAAELFGALDDKEALHLSASMCAEHRSAVVTEVRRRLRPEVNAPCRVISTQVIEAGVDVDFPTVFRAAAGLDSIAQAAGRCNREGRLRGNDNKPRLGSVYLFDYDETTYRTSHMLTRAAACFREIAPNHRDDLLSPSAIEAYFRLFYWQAGGDDGKGWDKGNRKASVMDAFDYSPKRNLHAQFREAADTYRIIEDGQTPILVPYGVKGEELVKQLEDMPVDPDPRLLRLLYRKLQRFTVGVFEAHVKKLLENQVLLDRHGIYYLGNKEAYDEKVGLRGDILGLDPERTIL